MYQPRNVSLVDEIRGVIWVARPIGVLARFADLIPIRHGPAKGPLYQTYVAGRLIALDASAQSELSGALWRWNSSGECNYREYQGGRLRALEARIPTRTFCLLAVRPSSTHHFARRRLDDHGEDAAVVCFQRVPRGS